MTKKEEYLKSHGTKCPHCGSENIQGGDIDPLDLSDEVRRTVNCLDCNSGWLEYFKLYDIEGLTDKDDETLKK